MKLQGSNSHGLYKVESSVPSSFFSECVPIGYLASLDTCHGRLGHPSYATIKSTLQNCNLVIHFSGNDSIIDKVCSSFQLAKSHKLPFVTSHMRVDKKIIVSGSMDYC